MHYAVHFSPTKIVYEEEVYKTSAAGTRLQKMDCR